MDKEGEKFEVEMHFWERLSLESRGIGHMTRSNKKTDYQGIDESNIITLVCMHDYVRLRRDKVCHSPTR